MQYADKQFRFAISHKQASSLFIRFFLLNTEHLRTVLQRLNYKTLPLTQSVVKHYNVYANLSSSFPPQYVPAHKVQYVQYRVWCFFFEQLLICHTSIFVSDLIIWIRLFVIHIFPIPTLQFSIHNTSWFSGCLLSLHTFITLYQLNLVASVIDITAPYYTLYTPLSILISPRYIWTFSDSKYSNRC